MELSRNFEFNQPKPIEPIFWVSLAMWLKKNPLTKAAEKIADLLGGADFGNYAEKLGQISANKGSHKLRSIANSPVHKKFWKKISKNKP